MAIKNIGKKRADFAKINFLFRMNWRGETKPLTCFAKGSIQDLGNGVVSDASIEPESIGNFELFIPKSFGTKNGGPMDAPALALTEKLAYIWIKSGGG